jgi:SRSO17 transposase
MKAKLRNFNSAVDSLNQPPPAPSVIAKEVGLKGDKVCIHHFLSDGNWKAEQVQHTQIEVTKAIKGTWSILWCIHEMGNAKRQAIDYVTKKYIGDLGPTENGIFSVNAYGVVSGMAYSLLLRIFQPKSWLKPGDDYKRNPIWY